MGLEDVNAQQLQGLAAQMLQKKMDELTQCAELAKRIAAGKMRFATSKLTVASFPGQDPSFGTPTKTVPELTVKMIQKGLQYFNVRYRAGARKPELVASLLQARAVHAASLESPELLRKAFSMCADSGAEAYLVSAATG